MWKKLGNILLQIIIPLATLAIAAGITAFIVWKWDINLSGG